MSEYHSQYQELGIQKEIDLDRKAFWKMLKAYVPQTGYEGIPNQILDIGCGKCREGAVLNSFFGGKRFGQPSQAVVINGIDIRSGMIEEAKEENRFAPFPLTLVCGDVTDIDRYPELPSVADIVVIRHQEIINDEDLWTKIFKKAVERLSDNGLGIITSYSDHEQEIALRKLKSLGVEIVLATKNKHSIQTRFKDVSIDKNIIFFKR